MHRLQAAAEVLSKDSATVADDTGTCSAGQTSESGVKGAPTADVCVHVQLICELTEHVSSLSGELEAANRTIQKLRRGRGRGEGERTEVDGSVRGSSAGSLALSRSQLSAGGSVYTASSGSSEYVLELVCFWCF